jgi:hypothetical protein
MYVEHVYVAKHKKINESELWWKLYLLKPLVEYIHV